jgi:hypothetical protein
MSEPSMDHEMEVRLRALYHVELERAASDLRAAPIARRTGVRSRSGVLTGGFATVAIAAVLLAALALRPGLGTNPGAGAATRTAPTSPATAVATVGSTPSATEPAGDGIPTTIDGQPVLTGAGIADAIANTTDDTPFLIGGWFPASDYYDKYCAALAPGPASCTPYKLHFSKGSQDAMWVYPATAAADILSYMATQPVVMRVHTHDPRCADLPNLDGCTTLPVLEAIVWLGPKS